ncbi:MAG: hypothetical protein AB2L11_12595 [Syntrophobacteraceae bacterium]
MCIQQVTVSLLGISSKIKVIVLKKAIQVSQNDFLWLQAVLEIAQLSRNLHFLVVPPVFSIAQRFVVPVRVKAELPHQLNIENLPLQKLSRYHY